MKPLAHILAGAETPGRAGVRRASRLPAIPRLFLAALLWTGCAVVQAAMLKDVQFAAQPGDRVDIQLILDTPIPEPGSFATEAPARIALDLPGVVNGLDRKSIPIGAGSVHSLVSVEAGGRTRVVVNLTQSLPYEVKSEGNRILLRVNPGTAELAAPTRAETAPAAERIAAAGAPSRVAAGGGPGPNLRDVDFRRGPGGEGRIQIRLPNAKTRVSVREEGTRVFVEIHDTSLPQRLLRRLDVMDFGTAVTAVETRPKGRNVEVTVLTGQDFEQMAYQTDDLFTLDFRTLTPAEKEELVRKQVVYSGDRLSLNFQDIEVRAVLQVLADFMDLNLVADQSVQGNITLRLKNVPSDQALDIILKTRQLGMRQQGNVLMVAPAEVLAAREQSEAQAVQTIEQLAPLRTEFIKINYAKAADLAAFLIGDTRIGSNTTQTREVEGTDGGSQTSTMINNMQTTPGGLLSDRGRATADVRTNTLIVVETAANLAEIREVIARLDIPTRQVLIESRVVSATNDFARDLGVRFGLSGSVGNLGSHELNMGGSRPGGFGPADFDKGPFGLNATTATPYNSGLTVGGAEGLLVNLPVTDPSGAVNFLIGKVGSYLLQLELSAMQTEGRGEIVSSPRIITSDQKKAVIKVGYEIPYQSSDGEGTPRTEFKEAKLELDVTPHITPDDRIIMDLVVTKDDPVSLTASEPPLFTRKVETSVLVANGETVVLGGVYERQKSFNKEQVPWFGDLPVMGRLFKKEQRTDINSELLIFVTPKILNSEIAQR